MKKIIALTLLCLGITSPSLAQRQTESKAEVTVTHAYQLDSLTLDDLKSHPEITGLLSGSERESLSQRLSLDPTPALWQNLIPFGYGSFQQGDTFGGVSIAVMDTLSLLAIASDLSVRNEIAPIPIGLLIYGPLLIIARIAGVVSPLLYAKGHNAEVKQLLSAPEVSRNPPEIDSNLFSYSMAF